MLPFSGIKLSNFAEKNKKTSIGSLPMDAFYIVTIIGLQPAQQKDRECR